MNFLELILTAIGLSMDAFAVSVTDGLCCKDLQKKHAVSIGLCFGIMQGLMPTIGFFLGQAFAEYITAVDHYIALILLGYIGGKMILDAIQESKQDEP
ncbi:MAG: manganese efflux pump, partial [Oscillospiraceae bacterium]|nr:manganese efflux pump [Oscillospiraceae bacterium]